MAPTGGTPFSGKVCETRRLPVERALCVEQPTDPPNQIDAAQVRKTALPWAVALRLRQTICGPLFAELFHQAFVGGLQDPEARPTAENWETALVTTANLLLPCADTGCELGMFVFDNSTRPACPYCGTRYGSVAPILTLYSSRPDSGFRPDNHRKTV